MAVVLTWFAVADLLITVLYFVMSWTDRLKLVPAAVVLSILALLLFAVSAKKEPVPTRWFSSFTVVTLTMFGALIIGWTQATAPVEFGTEHLATYYLQDSMYTDLKKQVEVKKTQFHADTAAVSFDSVAEKYFVNAFGVIEYIASLKSNLIDLSNDGVQNLPEGYGPLLYPAEYTLSTSYMVGPYVQYPTGKGMELYDSLWNYRSEVLHPDVALGIPVKNAMVDKEQWVKDNFYHIPALDVLTRLTTVQQNILVSINESIDKKLFIQQQ